MLALVLWSAVPAAGQEHGPPADKPATVVVSVRETNGAPFAGPALVHLHSNAVELSLQTTTGEDTQAVISGLAGGAYDVEVNSPGYKTAHESAFVSGDGGTYTVYVYLQPESSKEDRESPPSGMVLTPKLKKEIELGLHALRAKDYVQARKYLEKASRTDPRNADLQFLLGVLENSRQNTDAARKRFEAALAINPSDERALLSLGQMQFDAGQNKEAAVALEKAVQVNAVSWQAHMMLAVAYARLGEYEKARAHAVRLAEISKDKTAAALVLQGKILLLEGKREEARPLIEAAVRDFRKDPAALTAKRLLKELQEPSTSRAAGAPLELPIALPTPAYALPWAPQDIDAKVPGVAPGVSCSESIVVEETRARILGLLSNFEKFTATERIDHQQVDANGIPGAVKSREFSYLVFIEQPRKNEFYLNERRDGADSRDSFPTAIATVGLVSLGVDIFHPVFSSDFHFTCEGLGQWRGKPAWQLRFEQRAEVPSRIRDWMVGTQRFAVPLKGRVWVEANTFDPLHLETELREPIPLMELAREHLAVTYGPVKFEKAHTTLWLPLSAEMFLELRGKRYHHRHRLTNYQLFSVATKESIAAPKEN